MRQEERLDEVSGPQGLSLASADAPGGEGGSCEGLKSAEPRILQYQ